MKRKRISAVLTAGACAAMMLAYMPASMAQAATIVSNDFEVTYGGWYAVSPDSTAEAIVYDGIGFNGSRGMRVVGRTSPADGAVSEKDLYLVGGKEYDYSVRVFAETDQHFKLTLTLVDAKTGEETVKILDEKDVKGGEWATLSDTYTAPVNSVSFKLTITTDTTDDFVYDDVKVVGMQELTASAAHGTGIKDWIVNYGIRSGNILNGGTINNTDIKNILLKDCNAIECENETKPDATLVQSGSSNTNIRVKDDSFAKIADWCATNGLGFRGHTLVWHSQTPEWFFKDNFQNGGNWVNKATMEQRLESYIKNMFDLFKTKYSTLNLYAYDVCNECMNDSNGGPRQGGYGNGASPWVQVYGDNSFIDAAFKYARMYAPANCHLFYNDYNEYAGFKRDAILSTATRIKAAGNLDGVGMQSHINANANDGWSGENAYLTAMNKYLQAGLEVQITELDISTNGGQYSLDQQASRYKRILQEAVKWNSDTSHANRVTLFQVWGPNDGNSWVGTDKATGKSNAPLLYDKSNQPKAAYTALQSVVPQSEWGDGSNFKDGFEIKEPELDADGYWFHATFENGTDNFTGRGSASVASSSSEAYAGSKSLACTGREASWNGASMTLGRPFTAGETYSFSADVMYTTGSASEDFYLTLEYTDASGETQWPHIASATANKGEWAQLANVEFTIPAGATGISMYVETADSTIDFFVDEVIGAPKGTVIAGPAPAAPFVLGDVNADGIITAADLSAAKTAKASGKFLTARAERAADVDQSNEFTNDDIQYLSDYILTKITKFPVAEPVYKMPDFSQLESKYFANVKLGTSTKKDNENNPCTTQRYGADPGWQVYDGRLYLYTTNDALEYKSNGQIQDNTYNSGTINCISSADLVNWTDHGAIPVAGRNGRTTGGVAKWAANAWAPDALHKKINGKEKFFLYFANNGSGVGVLTSDSPTGPFVDPIGSELVSKSKVAGMNDVVWMFDPGVYYDEKTNEGYLFMGGGVDGRDKANPKTGRCMKLGDDMISISGNAVTLENPYLFEDSSLIKIGDTWYYSYCANWNVPGGTNINGVSFGNADILYMTSKNPLGPWTSSQLAGMCFANTGSQGIDKGGNNHHSIIEFKGEYYIAYHSRTTELRQGVRAYDNNGNAHDGGNYRSTHIDKATFNNGKITCKATMGGCQQLEYLNPFQTVQAETMANQSGIQIKGVGDTVVSDIQSGDWTMLKGVDFKNGAQAMTFRASSKNGGAIKVVDGSGNAFAYAEIPGGGSMQEITVGCSKISGVNDIRFIFSGDLEFDSWSAK
jgi:arabinoxylan arabinofuranohydrolase